MSPPVNAADVGPGHEHGHSQGSHLGSSLTYPRSASVLGYCLLPLVLVAMLGILVPLDGLFGYLLTSLAIAWCAYASSSMFTVVGKCTVYNTAVTCTNASARSNDIDERTGRVSYGSVLWQFWYYGYLQLKRNWAIGKGCRLLRQAKTTITSTHIALLFGAATKMIRIHLLIIDLSRSEQFAKMSALFTCLKFEPMGVPEIRGDDDGQKPCIFRAAKNSSFLSDNLRHTYLSLILFCTVLFPTYLFSYNHTPWVGFGQRLQLRRR
jgi:hypothetical protein